MNINLHTASQQISSSVAASSTSVHSLDRKAGTVFTESPIASPEEVYILNVNLMVASNNNNNNNVTFITPIKCVLQSKRNIQPN